jgi:NADPH-dependent glutamate synthase beta subunit-like oxidoreductase/Pyruvate/2-oxoacid:ferredoxin oxidoreductase delta subunit
MSGKTNPSTPNGVVIIGNTVPAVQTALSLAQMGVDVKIVTGKASLGCDDSNGTISDLNQNKHFLMPLFLRAACHPRVTLYTNSDVESIEGKKGDFKIQVVQRPRFIDEQLCTSCRRCQAECSARITALIDEHKVVHSAIHTPNLVSRSVPSAYVIDKDGMAPCQASCPLGINIQGFVSLLANGKPDKALSLITEKAPLAGILGRVCKHPCEEKCNRSKVDNPLTIRSLHRFAADNAGGGIVYKKKAEHVATKSKIAVIGSGPAGLTAAWELTRRGYLPVVFESHSVIGGMLATGIPRFRLPKEVREREIEAIIKQGVNIRTGITVGRDITLTYLKERGYNTFFLAIGTQQNNRLNIKGEDLDGVVDCLSLLLTLNLKVDTFVGSNIVIVGGGNAAIDCARVALRSGAQKVTIAYRRSGDEMPADPEEVIEALNEGINIEYQVIPVEILGHNSCVTSVLCQKTRRADEILENGQYKFEPIPDTEFVIEADHVVVAVGQSPNAAQLGFEGLKIDQRTGIIKVDPLTMETSIPGIFAGGDCVTGPNNVVDAMAAGLRAAESICRYIQGRDLVVRRNIEPPQTADVDLDMVEIRPFKRAVMPVLPLQKRKNSFEETTTGLSTVVASKEAQRCLNCGLCSQCMECAAVCEAGAVCHSDSTKHLELGAQTVLKFPLADTKRVESQVGEARQESAKKGIYVIAPSEDTLENQLTTAMAAAFETMMDISPGKMEKEDTDQFKKLVSTQSDKSDSESIIDNRKQTGVFLCRCNGSIDTILDFQGITRHLVETDGVAFVGEISQACVEINTEQIAGIVRDQKLERIVVAACRCCNIDQLCYSCSDRRRICLQLISDKLASASSLVIEYVNIREQCAWLNKDEPGAATEKALQIISAGVARARLAQQQEKVKRIILPSIAVIGGDEATVISANALASRGYQVTFITCFEPKRDTAKDKKDLFEQLKDSDIDVRKWSEMASFNGSPGYYEMTFHNGLDGDCIKVGAVLVSISGVNKSSLDCAKGLLGRVIAHAMKNEDYGDFISAACRNVTFRDNSGIFILQTERESSPGSKLYGLAAANQVTGYIEQPGISGTNVAVKISDGLCRGCGDCSKICPYIETRQREDGTTYAYIDTALCTGCGLCISCCPAGAITQPMQSDEQIIATLRVMLTQPRVLSEVYE